MIFGEKTGAPSERILNIRSGPDGALWFATAGGLYQYEEQVFTSYAKADGFPEYEVSLSSSLGDGSVWFSGYGTFLTRIKPASTNVWEKRFVNAREEGFETTGVYALKPDAQGGLWLGGTPEMGGIYYCDPESVARKRPLFRKLTGPQVLDSGLSFAFHIDSQERMWIGKFNQGLYRSR